MRTSRRMSGSYWRTNSTAASSSPARMRRMKSANVVRSGMTQLSAAKVALWIIFNRRERAMPSNYWNGRRNPLYRQRPAETVEYPVFANADLLVFLSFLLIVPLPIAFGFRNAFGHDRLHNSRFIAAHIETDVWPCRGRRGTLVPGAGPASASVPACA